jgi:trk system potassium uptake protein TrkA
MHVIVVGCGRVGSELADRLQREGHTVAVLDKNPNAFRRLPDPWPGDKVVGFGFDRDDLNRAGIDRAGAVAAVTSGDNTNILTARIARETFEVNNVVARIYDPRRAAIYQRLGIATVATVSWTVDQVARRLIPGEVRSAWTDPTGAVNLVEYPLPEALCGKPLAELGDGDRYKPVLVTRGGQARLATHGLVGQEGDIVHFAVRTEDLAAINNKLASAHGRPGAAMRPDGAATASAGPVPGPKTEHGGDR